MKGLVLVIPCLIIFVILVLWIMYLAKFEKEHTPNDGYNI
jgi:hypothetical protein